MTARRARVSLWHAVAQRTGSSACDQSRERAKLAVSRSATRSSRARARSTARKYGHANWRARRRVVQVRGCSIKLRGSDRRRSPADDPNNGRSRGPSLARGFSRGRNLARRDPRRNPCGTCPFQGPHDVFRYAAAEIERGIHSKESTPPHPGSGITVACSTISAPAAASSLDPSHVSAGRDCATSQITPRSK